MTSRRKDEAGTKATRTKAIAYSATSDRAIRFCEEFLVDCNGAAAARRAGYAERSSRDAASELLGLPEIQARIKELQEARAERVQIDADYVLHGIREAAERCMQREPVMVRRGKEMVQMVDDEGRHVWKFDSQGALRAFEALGKHLGLFIERTDITSGGKPLPPTQINVTLVAAQKVGGE